MRETVFGHSAREADSAAIVTTSTFGVGFAVAVAEGFGFGVGVGVCAGVAEGLACCGGGVGSNCGMMMTVFNVPSSVGTENSTSADPGLFCRPR